LDNFIVINESNKMSKIIIKGEIMRKKFSEEQKRQAVKLVEEAGVKSSQVESEFGIGKTTLWKWREKYSRETNTATSIRNESVEWQEYHKMKRELFKEKQKVEILKKAISYFSHE
jgi:transposase